MYCTKCGNKTEGQSFCSICGTPVAQQQSQGFAPPQQQQGYYQQPQPQNYSNSTMSTTSTSYVGDSMSTALGGGSTHQPSQKNNMAASGLVCAIIGLIFFPFEIIGLILSIIGLVKSKSLNGTGKGTAIAGIIIGLIGVGTLIYGFIGGNPFFWF